MAGEGEDEPEGDDGDGEEDGDHGASVPPAPSTVLGRAFEVAVNGRRRGGPSVRT
jgi:hypothetical protein